MTAQPVPPAQQDVEEVKREVAEGVAKLEATGFAHATPGVRREMARFWRAAIYVIALTLSTFHLYTGIFGTLPSHQQRTFHLAFGLGLIFLLYPAKPQHRRREQIRGWVASASALAVLGWLVVMGEAHVYVAGPAFVVLAAVQAARYLPLRVGGMPIADVLLSGLGFFAGLYIFVNSEEIIASAGEIVASNTAVGVIGILLVLVAAQRAIGTALVVVATVMLAYAYVGPWMPGFLNHQGYSLDRIVSTSFLTTEGVLGTPIAISSTFIFLFMIFAAMLQRTGMEKFFTEFAFGATGWMTGGTAKVGVVTSAFSGTITGSSIANVVSNGAFTIPMMKKAGYSKEFAGAVEAASSTGGQIAPPVMGAAAFIMIDMTGVPYLEIMKAAIIPAALFFAAQFVVVHYESKKLGILGLPRAALPSVVNLLRTRGYLVFPIIVLFVFLSMGYSPIRAAIIGIGFSVGVNLLAQVVYAVLGRWRQMQDKITPRTFLDGMVDAARIALPIIAACAAAGMVAGVITLTGLGLKLSGGLVALAGGYLIPTLVMVMIACLILGMGLPTTANYVITATLAAPAIIAILKGGAEDPTVAMLLAAHMFVFYFGVMADITPPVCLAGFAAAGISGGSPVRTGVQSVRIAISGFLVPYILVLSPELLLQGDIIWPLLIWTIITAMIGATLVGVGVVGYVKTAVFWPLRLVAIAGGLALIHSGLVSDVIGLAAFALVFGLQWFSGRKTKVAEVTS
ncbi:MAG: TRAP transporter fused permease subunit [Streptosporangiales bacterium]|nr:TRAP transporter fused permease subunit [Streptosporangiales bacterium]